MKNSKQKNIIKNKKDCCMQSLNEINNFLNNFTNFKKALKIFKWLK